MKRKKVQPRKKPNISNFKEEDFLEKLGKRIKALRQQQGFTSYEHFAYDLEISRSGYGRYETGADMRVSTLAKIVHGLGISLDEFFAEGFD